MDEDQTPIFLPKEIVDEILIRLPLKALYKCTSVSKQWKSTISNLEFANTYMNRARETSLSVEILHPYMNDFDINPDQTPKRATVPTAPVDIDLANQSLHISIFSIYKRKQEEKIYEILDSTNGLILSITEFIPSDLIVSNPLTNQSVQLPPPPGGSFCFSECRVFFTSRCREPGGENAAYITYKVVAIQPRIRQSELIPSEKSSIVIFSSDTGSWGSEELIHCPQVILRKFNHTAKASSYKGILHWFDWETRTIVTYDPFDSPSRFGHIDLPSGSVGSSGMNLIHLCDYDDFPMICEIELSWLCIWRLVDYDKQEWRREQRCWISSEGLNQFSWLLSESGNTAVLVAVRPWNGELSNYLMSRYNMVSAIDLRNGRVEFVKVDQVNEYRRAGMDVCRRTGIGHMRPLVPIALCPWSSPFYGEAATRSSSDIGGCREILPLHFASITTF